MPIELDLSQSQLDELYEWVDRLNLSRPKKNINRDYADAVMMAQTIHQFLPKLVQIHNYPASNSVRTKIQNWKMLNNKVLARLGLDLNPFEIQKLAESAPMYIEGLLHSFRRIIVPTDSPTKKQRQESNIDRKISLKKNQFGYENGQKLNKADELREILSLLKEKIYFLERTIVRKDSQIKQLQDIIKVQSK